MQFTLKKQVAKVAHVNLREEKHGEDSVLACDVKVVTDVSNTFLDQLSASLRSSFYQAEGEGSSSQPGLLADATHLPVLRHPFLGRQKAEGVKMSMAHVVFHGARKADDVRVEADVNDLRLELKEGGTVEITFRCQLVPDSAQVAAISAHLGRQVKISVSPNDSPEAPPESEE